MPLAGIVEVVFGVEDFNFGLANPNAVRYAPDVINGYGHYNEEYVRTDDGWRLKSCVLTRLRVDSNIELNGG